LSALEVDFPLIAETHRATYLDDADLLRPPRWRRHAIHVQQRAKGQPTAPLPDGFTANSTQPLAETIARRRSSRTFARQAIAGETLSALLSAALVPYPCDLVASPRPDVAVVISDVAGFDPGAYRYDPDANLLTRTHVGNLRQKVAYLSLEQRLCGDAAASIFFLADLDRGYSEDGEREYRRCQIDAGIRGEFVYLAARALDVGCSGIGAYYDDEMAAFWEAAPRSSVIYELVVGPEPADERAPGSARANGE
jgi:SagB-type dehydrogenase family enzyme